MVCIHWELKKIHSTYPENGKNGLIPLYNFNYTMNGVNLNESYNKATG